MKNLVTHTTAAGYLYRIVAEETRSGSIINTGVEFWDSYCNKWRPSIIRQRDLIKIGGNKG